MADLRFRNPLWQIRRTHKSVPPLPGLALRPLRKSLACRCRVPGPRRWSKDRECASPHPPLMECAQGILCGFEVATFYLAAMEAGDTSAPRLVAGGDFYEVAARDNRDVVLAVGDICGHGPAAAAQAVRVRTALQASYRHTRTPAAALSLLNNLLARKTTGGSTIRTAKTEIGFERFTALCLAMGDGYTGTIRVASAGIEGALILRPESGIESIPCENLLLGLWPSLVYEEREYHLSPGDVLIFATDGITEARNAEGTILGLERLKKLLEERRDLWEAPCHAGQELLNAIREYCGGAPADDICLLVARWHGPESVSR